MADEESSLDSANVLDLLLDMPWAPEGSCRGGMKVESEGFPEVGETLFPGEEGTPSAPPFAGCSVVGGGKTELLGPSADESEKERGGVRGERGAVLAVMVFVDSPSCFLA